MTYSRVEQAARNNAVWCETICCIHGTPGEFHDTLWLNRHPVPRFYPNVVTLAPQAGTAAQLAHIQALVATGLPGRWGVKDSFCALDLTALGFQPLFDATWLWRAPCQPLPSRAASGLHWTWVQSASELAQWETVWSGSPANNPSPQHPRLFLPALLAHPEIVFIVAYQHQDVVAGAIAHHTDEVVGLSNVLCHWRLRWRAGRAVSLWLRSASQGCRWWGMSTGPHSHSLRRSALPCCTRCRSGPGRQSLDTAQQGLAPDCLQPSLLRRCGIRRQVKPAVRRTSAGERS